MLEVYKDTCETFNRNATNVFSGRDEMVWEDSFQIGIILERNLVTQFPIILCFCKWLMRQNIMKEGN